MRFSSCRIILSSSRDRTAPPSLLRLPKHIVDDPFDLATLAVVTEKFGTRSIRYEKRGVLIGAAAPFWNERISFFFSPSRCPGGFSGSNWRGLKGISQDLRARQVYQAGYRAGCRRDLSVVRPKLCFVERARLDRDGSARRESLIRSSGLRG